MIEKAKQPLSFQQQCIVDLYKLYAVPGRRKPTAVAIASAFSRSFKPTVSQVRFALRRAGQKRGSALCLIDWEAEPLGQVPDTQIAKRLGVSAETVRQKRRALGIEAYRKRGDGIDWTAQPLGQIKDAQLAKRLGVSCAKVQSARRAQGTAPLGGRGGPRNFARLKVPLALEQAWARLYQEGVLVPQIKARYPKYSHALISRRIRKVLGVARLGPHVPKRRAA